MSNHACVYGIEDTETGELIYVGKTNSFRERKATHFSKGNDKVNIGRYMRTFPDWRNRFNMFILKEGLSILSVDEFERKFIQEYAPSQNILRYDSGRFE